jgi:hypothetical protein
MYEFHDLAAIVPLSSNKEIQSLTYDISVNGQIEKALVWQNKIIDGRNRSIACNNLGLELKVEILPDAMTYDEVLNLVISKNIRRSLSTTQKAISAYNAYKKMKQDSKKISTSQIANNWGISNSALEAVIFVSKNQPEYIDILFNGNKVRVANAVNGEVITTNSIVTLSRIIRSNIKNGIVIHREFNTYQNSQSSEGFVNNEAYEWYVQNHGLIKDNSAKIDEILREHANMKFGKE